MQEAANRRLNVLFSGDSWCCLDNYSWMGWTIYTDARVCAYACVWCDRSNQITAPTVSPVKSMAAETARGRRSRFARLSCSLFVSQAECDLALAARHQTGGKRRRRLSDTERAKTGGGGRRERVATGGKKEKRRGRLRWVGLGFGGWVVTVPPLRRERLLRVLRLRRFPNSIRLPVCAAGDVLVHNYIFLEGTQDGPAHPAKWIFSLIKYTLEQLYYGFLPRISILMN